MIVPLWKATDTGNGGGGVDNGGGCAGTTNVPAIFAAGEVNCICAAGGCGGNPGGIGAGACWTSVCHCYFCWKWFASAAGAAASLTSGAADGAAASWTSGAAVADADSTDAAAAAFKV